MTHTFVTALDASSRLLAFLANEPEDTPGSLSPEALDAQAEGVMPAAAAKVAAPSLRRRPGRPSPP